MKAIGELWTGDGTLVLEFGPAAGAGEAAGGEAAGGADGEPAAGKAEAEPEAEPEPEPEPEAEGEGETVWYEAVLDVSKGTDKKGRVQWAGGYGVVYSSSELETWAPRVRHRLWLDLPLPLYRLCLGLPLPLHRLCLPLPLH